MLRLVVNIFNRLNSCSLHADAEYHAAFVLLAYAPIQEWKRKPGRPIYLAAECHFSASDAWTAATDRGTAVLR